MKLKSQFKKRIIYITLFVLIATIAAVSSSSLALFTTSNEIKNVDIVVGNITYNLESKDLNTKNQIIIPGETEREVIINITPNEDVDSRYELYYNLLGNYTEDDIVVSYEIGTPSGVNDIIESNTTKTIYVLITNYSTSSITVEFGAQGGFERNEIILTKGKKIEIGRYINAVEKIENAIMINSEEFKVTNNDEYRYVGTNVNNYVTFNDETWRIIGLFNVDDGHGVVSKRLKIIRDTPLTGIPYDSSGKNDYSKSSIDSYLNETYLNSLTESSKLMLDTAKWYIAGHNSSGVNVSQMYQFERSDEVWSSNAKETVAVIGLPYVSDYGFSIEENSCLSTTFLSELATCSTSTWMNNGKSLTITPMTNFSNYNYVIENGSLYYANTTSTAYNTFPTLYLKYNTFIGSGNGSKDDPYLLVSNHYQDDSGANIPELNDNMIPVIYDDVNKVWVKSSYEEKWYDYDNQMWANAVTVSESTRSTYLKAKTGTPVKLEDINAMYVWIPRYEYKIGTKEEEIDVNFIGNSITSPTANYIINSAFTFGDKQLNGFWVGKFEISGSTSEIKIIPNVTSLRKYNVSTFYQSIVNMNTANNIYGLTTKMDSHMIKNTEWGAVAYLSQSKFGKYGNSNYTGANKEIFNNNSSSFITGSSGSSPSAAADSSTVTYDVIGSGTGASTTGTIYGVYDMNGGANDYVMGVMYYSNNSTLMSGNSSSLNSGFTGRTYGWLIYGSYSGVAYPDAKYFNAYKFGSSTGDTNRYINGDATIETKGWYSDRLDFVYNQAPWFARGGPFNKGSETGIFSSLATYGSADDNYSTRVVLTSTK